MNGVAATARRKALEEDAEEERGTAPESPKIRRKAPQPEATEEGEAPDIWVDVVRAEMAASFRNADTT